MVMLCNVAPETWTPAEFSEAVEQLERWLSCRRYPLTRDGQPLPQDVLIVQARIAADLGSYARRAGVELRTRITARDGRVHVEIQSMPTKTEDDHIRCPACGGRVCCRESSDLPPIDIFSVSACPHCRVLLRFPTEYWAPVVVLEEAWQAATSDPKRTVGEIKAALAAYRAGEAGVAAQLTCGSNKAPSGYVACGQPAEHFYLHNGDLCAYCTEHKYVCGDPQTREQAIAHLAAPANNRARTSEPTARPWHPTEADVDRMAHTAWQVYQAATSYQFRSTDDSAHFRGLVLDWLAREHAEYKGRTFGIAAYEAARVAVLEMASLARADAERLDVQARIIHDHECRYTRAEKTAAQAIDPAAIAEVAIVRAKVERIADMSPTEFQGASCTACQGAGWAEHAGDLPDGSDVPWMLSLIDSLLEQLQATALTNRAQVQFTEPERDAVRAFVSELPTCIDCKTPTLREAGPHCETWTECHKCGNVEPDAAARTLAALLTYVSSWGTKGDQTTWQTTDVALR